MDLILTSSDGHTIFYLYTTKKKFVSKKLLRFVLCLKKHNKALQVIDSGSVREL